MMLKKFDEAFGDSKQAMEVDPAFVKGYIRGVYRHTKFTFTKPTHAHLRAPHGCFWGT